MEVRLKEGGLKVADIGCGHGISTILMAKAYPNSKFYGFDNHAASIDYARNKAREEDLDEDRIKFEVASSTNFSTAPNRTYDFSTSHNQEGANYDLITFFDCLHDMEDPQGAASHALKRLKPDGTVMIVEPFANDTVQGNLNPLGRLFYARFYDGMYTCIFEPEWACFRCSSR